MHIHHKQSKITEVRALLSGDHKCSISLCADNPAGLVVIVRESRKVFFHKRPNKNIFL